MVTTIMANVYTVSYHLVTTCVYIVVAPTFMPKHKNAVRCAPPPFLEPVDVVSFRDADGKPAFGHRVDDEHVLPLMRAACIRTTDFVRVLPSINPIPVGACFQRDGGSLDTEFYVFDSPHPHLFVRIPRGATASMATDHLPSATIATIQALYADTCPAPWDEFFVNSAATDTVWRVDTTTVSRTAASYLEAGFIVACVGVPARFTRVRSMQLKWTPDSECAKSMSTIADAIPGLDVHAASSIYTSDFQVQRQMLFWGMLAGCMGRAASGDTLLCEPLQSYVSALEAVKDYRRRHRSIEGCDVTPRFNVAARLSPSQEAHAMALYYWACIHSTPPSEADASLYCIALRMYTMFGHVIVRKRGYEFHACAAKKPRVSKQIKSKV